MPRPTGKIQVDTNNEKYDKLRAKFIGIAPNAIDLFDQINNYVRDNLLEEVFGPGLRHSQKLPKRDSPSFG